MQRSVTAIIQARMTSTRLPGKVMLEVLGKPLLGYLVERLADAARIDRIVVATTTNPEDDIVAEFSRKAGLDLFRGSEHNVLERYTRAATVYQADHILRITADCPLIDPVLVDALVDFYFKGEFDYALNCEPPTLPDGLDAEVFSFAVLQQTHENATLPSEREHVTPYMRKHPEIFSIGRWRNAQDWSHLRWTVDEPEDFHLVSRVIKALYSQNQHFGTTDVMALLAQNPTLGTINARFQRNEGMLSSRLLDDKQIGL